MRMPTRQSKPQLQEWRCPVCDRLLQEHRLPTGEPYLIVVKCPRCKSMVTLQNDPGSRAA